MRVVINSCYGGFSLSAMATKLYYEKRGKEVYFFKGGLGKEPYVEISLDKADSTFFWHSFNTPTPPDPNNKSESHEWNKQYLTNRPEDRSDPDLITVVEELGPAANGSCASLRIVEIPDGVAWGIHEYDGYESVEEVHRSWS